ncbi:hypothetical protein VaNZ11_002440 [Volvox africanus]|uniref:Uncharacterized protein n=1 Tax=Volvox africanus TaxID=51714 RepID=A0ABQ5RSP0_9CHLO|nr:hypothetical protein VaNZ11_002440 [Volvox africanus]
MSILTLNRAASYSPDCSSPSAAAAIAATWPAAVAKVPDTGGGGGNSCPTCEPLFPLDAAMPASFPCAAGDLRQYSYTLRNLHANVLYAAARGDLNVLLYMA